MNLDNLKTLITTVEKADRDGMFDMGRYYHPCSTPSCIAAYARALNLGEETPSAADSGVYRTHLALYLEISADESTDLAERWGHLGGEIPTTKQSLRLLRQMLSENRTIKWREFLPPR
jgi:hypothetical protein